MATAMRSSPGLVNTSTNKRKRGPNEDDLGRNVKAQNTNGDHDANYAALLQGIEAGMSGDDSTRTAQAALATPMNQSAYPEPGPFDGTPGLPPGFDDTSPGGTSLGPGAQALYEARQAQGQGQNPSKPAVGTNEWHQLRKDNHKEVERRRREVINEGIENIAKIVPNCEKNKGAILQRTHQYIGELQTKAAQFDNERATFDVALKELTSRNDRLRESARGAWAESAKWQQRCRDAGLQFDDYDGGALGSLEDDELDVVTGGS